MTGLTLVRRIKARPSIVFDTLTTAEGIAGWNEAFDELQPNATRIAKEHIA